MLTNSQDAELAHALAVLSTAHVLAWTRNANGEFQCGIADITINPQGVGCVINHETIRLKSTSAEELMRSVLGSGPGVAKVQTAGSSEG